MRRSTLGQSISDSEQNQAALFALSLVWRRVVEYGQVF